MPSRYALHQQPHHNASRHALNPPPRRSPADRPFRVLPAGTAKPDIPVISAIYQG
jgi:hypothetical protein